MQKFIGGITSNEHFKSSRDYFDYEDDTVRCTSSDLPENSYSFIIRSLMKPETYFCTSVEVMDGQCGENYQSIITKS